MYKSPCETINNLYPLTHSFDLSKAYAVAGVANLSASHCNWWVLGDPSSDYNISWFGKTTAAVAKVEFKILTKKKNVLFKYKFICFSCVFGQQPR